MWRHFWAVGCLSPWLLAVANSFVCSADAWGAHYELKTLASFNGANGSHPAGGLILDAEENLYGVTYNGGEFKYGTVFQLAHGSQTITTLASFEGPNGSYPAGSLIADASGSLFGTTSQGGADNRGTIFKITSGSHTITTFASFDTTNGENPYAGLIADSLGNLYGTAAYGGEYLRGTVFEIMAGSSKITRLASFGFNSGENPFAATLADGQGNLFGTTYTGGEFQYGTVFKFAAESNTITTLDSFSWLTKGAYPQSNLIADASGNLYGTTQYGGEYGAGTVFELAAGSNTITPLVSFDGTNGALPIGGLIFDASGNLYGTTVEGGASNKGTIFRLAADSHSITTLVSFEGTNGSGPRGQLIADSQGNLYGITGDGGASDVGSVFKLELVPEPASWLMLAVGGIVAIVFKMRLSQARF